MTSTKTPAGRYIYATIDSSDAEYCAGLVGIGNEPVKVIVEGPVAAVVSAIGAKRIRPERANIAAHNLVTKSLMEKTTLLPVAFGTIANTAQEVRGMLTKNRDTFARQLDRVRGKVEMGLRVRIDVANIYEYIVNTHVELRTLRDAAFALPNGPGRDEKIEIGRQFDRSLAKERETHTATVAKVLKKCCVEIKEIPPRNEAEVINLACLIERGNQQAFEDAVLEAANKFDNNYAFDYTGPWAPHNFIDIHLAPNLANATSR